MRASTWPRTTRRGTANFNWNLFAHNTWNTTGYGVWLADLAAFLDLDRLCKALTPTFGFANRSGAALRNHFANTVGAGFCLTLGNHFARCVVTNLGAVLTNHTANLVAHFLGAAFWNHLACSVIANLGPILTSHSTDFVAHFLGLTFRYHSTDRVVASLCTALWHHFADTIRTGFGFTLWYNTAHCIRHLASATFASISRACNLFLFACWHPNLFTDRSGRTLYAFSTTFSGCINAPASARIKRPAPPFTHGLFHDPPRNGFGLGFPMPTFHSYGLCVLFWHTNAVLLGSHFLLTNGIVNCVVHLSCFGFINWFAYRVLDRSRLCFINGLAHRVVNSFRACFVNRLFDGVVDRTLMRLVDGLTHRVLDCFLTSLVHGATDRIIDGPLVLFVNRFTNGVVDCPGARLVFRHHDGVVDITSRCLRNKATALDLTILVVNFIPCAISSLFDSVVHRFSHCSHASVSSARHWGSRDLTAISGFSASTTALVADSATIRGTRGICTGHDRTDHDGGYDPQPIHSDFSRGNNTSVARRSFGDNRASALMARHRSSCLFPDAVLGSPDPM